jgi:hypothetical protein
MPIHWVTEIRSPPHGARYLCNEAVGGTLRKGTMDEKSTVTCKNCLRMLAKMKEGK